MTRPDDVQVLRALAAALDLRAVEAPPADHPAEEPDEAWVDAMLRRVVPGAAVDDEPAPAEVVPFARPARRRFALVAVACAAVAAVVTGLVVARPAPAVAVIPPVLAFSQIDPRDLAPTSGQPAAPALRRIAAAAAKLRPERRPASATTQRVTTDQWRLEVTVEGGAVRLAIRPTHQDSWLSSDGRVRLREVATAPQFDESGRQAGDDRSGDVTRDDVSSAGARGALWAQRLPRNPDELRAVLTAGGEADAKPTTPTVVLAGNIQSVFDRWVVDPDLAAAMWSALAQMDGVRDLGDVRDREGRPGRAFAVWDENAQTLEVLIVDPRTGALLGVEGVLFGYPNVETDQRLDEPRVGYFTTYLGSSWVPAD